jgi:hypothetical protein
MSCMDRGVIRYISSICLTAHACPTVRDDLHDRTYGLPVASCDSVSYLP